MKNANDDDEVFPKNGVDLFALEVFVLNYYLRLGVVVVIFS